MGNEVGGSDPDPWSRWLLHHRDADDPQVRRAMRAAVDLYVDRVIDGARLAPGHSLLDVGTGEGLVAFRALERVGRSLRVSLADVSATLLEHARARAGELGVLDRCAFFAASADRLDGLADASMDAVATRSVLAYVDDKLGALREFRRVLKAGGRISLGEPVFQDEALGVQAIRSMLDAAPAEQGDSLMRLVHRWRAAQFPDTTASIMASPLTNYNERDLLRLAQAAGFVDLHLELHVDVGPSTIKSWDAFLDSSPHPLAPTLRQIMDEQFTSSERQSFERGMRPVIEDPNAVSTDRMAYLTARKPGA